MGVGRGAIVAPMALDLADLYHLDLVRLKIDADAKREVLWCVSRVSREVPGSRWKMINEADKRGFSRQAREACSWYSLLPK